MRPAVSTRLGAWRTVYVVTLVCLTLAGSQFATAAGLVFYPRYLAAALLALLSWRPPLEGRRRLRDQSDATRLLVSGLWLMVAVAAASAAWSFNPALTLQQAAALAILAAVIHGLTTGRWAGGSHRATVYSDLAAAYWVCVGAALGGFLAGRLGFETRTYPDNRFRGAFENPNLLGLVCVIAILLGLALFAARRSWVYLAGLVPLLVSIDLAESRTAALALALAALISAPRLGLRVMAPMLYAVALAITVALIVHPALFDQLGTSGLAQRFTTADAFGGRTVSWSDAILVWKQQPLFGYGYGAGPSLFDELYHAGEIKFSLGVVHDSYLQWLVETGLLGAVPMLMALAACLLGVLRSRDTWLAAIPVAGLATCLTESALLGTGQPYPYLIWFGIAAVCCLAQPDEEPPPRVGPVHQRKTMKTLVAASPTSPPTGP